MRYSWPMKTHEIYLYNEKIWDLRVQWKHMKFTLPMKTHEIYLANKNTWKLPGKWKHMRYTWPMITHDIYLANEKQRIQYTSMSEHSLSQLISNWWSLKSDTFLINKRFRFVVYSNILSDFHQYWISLPQKIVNF